jgi:hypothetical protein
MGAMSREEFEALADEWQQTGGWAPPLSLVEDLIETAQHLWTRYICDECYLNRGTHGLCGDECACLCERD